MMVIHGLTLCCPFPISGASCRRGATAQRFAEVIVLECRRHALDIGWF
jgi:hypothetical protein